MDKLKQTIKENNRNIILFFLFFSIFLFIFLSYYPGILTYDSNVQWNEVITGKLTNSHPFLSTYFIYILSKIHKTTTTIILFQMLISSLTLVRILKITREKNMKFWIEIILAIIISFTPIICIYNITLWKDILYSYYLLNYGISLYEWNEKKYKYKIGNYIIMGLLLFLIYNYRLNGMIVSTLLLIITLFIMKKNKISKKIVLKFIMTVLLFNIILQVPKNYYTNLSKTDSNEKSIGTINTYMVWIYGQYLSDDIITNKKDLTLLNNVANIDEWKYAYSGYLINNTSLMSIDKDYLLKNQKEFRKIFIKSTVKNPISFIKHYLKADSILIMPISHGYVYSYDFSDWGEMSSFNSKINPVLKNFHNFYDKVINFTLNCKYINVLHFPANILYLCIIVVIILNKVEKTKKYWLTILPMLANTLSLLPINIAQDLRYVYINYITLVFIIMIVINKLIARRYNNENTTNNSFIQRRKKYIKSL